MYNNGTNGVGGGGGGGSTINSNNEHNESIISNNSQLLGSDQQQQQLDSLSNLFINDWETDDAALEQYESEMDRNINDNLLNEKKQSNQRLFQSFQTSACAVAQMFKDKTASPSSTNTSSNSNSSAPLLSSWQSFQNSAGAITVLYKDSLEACKVHMDLGICIGQQRKLKEIINWIKKKKKRTIRKDELISFLIGKQYTNTSNQNQMFNLFNQQNNSNANSGLTNNSFSNNLISNSSTTSQQAQQTTQASPFFTAPNRRQQSMNRQQQTQLARSNNNNNQSSNLASNTVGLSLNPIGENSSGSNDSQAVETNSDLATFREALIMHNRSRDAPPNRSHHHNHMHSQTHQNHLNNHHNHQHLYHSQNTTTNSTGISTNQTTNPQQLTNMTTTTTTATAAPSCDDLDCFFCEQIATHIEHKRSANSNNFNIDMESPTRKRGRFY